MSWVTPEFHCRCLVFRADVAIILVDPSPLLMSDVSCWCRIRSDIHVAITMMSGVPRTADVWCSMLMSHLFWLTRRHYWCLMFHADVTFVLPNMSPLLMSGVPCCRWHSFWPTHRHCWSTADVWCSVLMSHSFWLTRHLCWCLVVHCRCLVFHSTHHICWWPHTYCVSPNSSSTSHNVVVTMISKCVFVLTNDIHVCTVHLT